MLARALFLHRERKRGKENLCDPMDQTHGEWTKSEANIYHALLLSVPFLLLKPLVGLFDLQTTWQESNIYKKEDEEKERESQGRAAGPWVPVDKAIMDYHN